VRRKDEGVIMREERTTEKREEGEKGRKRGKKVPASSKSVLIHSTPVPANHWRYASGSPATK
jgi:hypothetical protein